MAKSKIKKDIEKVYREIQEFTEETKGPRERINFQRKQLQFLRADVHRPKIPFRRCMLSEKRKKERRIKSIDRKADVGLNRTRRSK